jgi:hypothetical protein
MKSQFGFTHIIRLDDVREAQSGFRKTCGPKPKSSKTV